MATGANAIPLGKIHPILAGRLNDPQPQQENPTSKAMSRSEELKQHLEAAKRAASALFPSKSPYFVRFALWVCVVKMNKTKKRKEELGQDGSCGTG